jgi:hypothetical protein
VSWLKLARLAAELALDLVREAVRPKPKPPLPLRDVLRQSEASHCAGHESEPRCLH